MTGVTTQRTTEQLRADVQALEELVASRGWELMRQLMDSQVTAAAYDLASIANLPETTLHFMRGAIRATSNFREAPDKYCATMKSELAMMEAIAASKTPR